jgi:hypothetical protein
MVKIFTEEDRKAGQIARQAKIKDLKAQTKDYKKDWFDENWWVELSVSRGIRLPPMYVPATEKGLKKWARKLTKLPFVEHFGCSPKELIRKNPKQPLRAFVGQMLEP